MVTTCAALVAISSLARSICAGESIRRTCVGRTGECASAIDLKADFTSSAPMPLSRTVTGDQPRPSILAPSSTARCTSTAPTPFRPGEEVGVTSSPSSADAGGEMSALERVRVCVLPVPLPPSDASVCALGATAGVGGAAGVGAPPPPHPPPPPMARMGMADLRRGERAGEPRGDGVALVKPDVLMCWS